jgi:hypothetical protein
VRVHGHSRKQNPQRRSVGSLFSYNRVIGEKEDGNDGDEQEDDTSDIVMLP